MSPYCEEPNQFVWLSSTHKEYLEGFRASTRLKYPNYGAKIINNKNGSASQNIVLVSVEKGVEYRLSPAHIELQMESRWNKT